MLDRVREACFGKLMDLVDEARVLDLFAGTGSLGLEALSRGAASARMVERHAKTAQLLAANVETLGLEAEAEVVTGDALRPRSWRPADSPPGERWADLIFFDPPYPFLSDPAKLAALWEALSELTRDVLKEEGILVFHTPGRGVWRSRMEERRVLDERTYGTSSLWYLGAEA